MKRVKKFCHIHEAPEGQVLFTVEENENSESYKVSARFMWEDLDISVSVVSVELTQEQALEILETMNYENYSKMALEQIENMAPSLFIED